MSAINLKWASKQLLTLANCWAVAIRKGHLPSPNHRKIQLQSPAPADRQKEQDN